MLTDNDNICQLNTENLDDIMQLQSSVIDSLEDKNLLRKNSREMFETVLNSGGCCIGVYEEDVLVACGLSHLCQGSAEDLSLHLEQHHCNNPVNMKSIMVHPGYRGRGLQRKLMTIIETKLSVRGFDALICTVDPDNKFSISNVLKMGYVFDHQETKYGGLIRSVYFKNLNQ